MNKTEFERRTKLLEDLDGAAYECTGCLQALLCMHRDGELVIPDHALHVSTRSMENFHALTAMYRAINVTDKMMKEPPDAKTG